jgi:hypothetical protein
MNPEREHEIEIDLCLSCGSYFGHTKSLEALWRNSRYRNANEKIMPQLCCKCMDSQYGEG